MKSTVPVANCTGCAACRFICTQDAINMVEDGEGFLYPQINIDKCKRCGLCFDLCPANNLMVQKWKSKPIVYAGWTNDLELLQQSSSGGVFSEIARKVLEKNGVVFGAAYDESMVVRHIAVENWKDLKELRGSKYVQSDVGITYRLVENNLKSGRPVLFSGTSCQIAGLYAVIGFRHELLLTTDLICHGVPSPKVFRKAIESIEKHHKSKVIAIFFRNKSFGWLHPMVRTVMNNGMYINENHVDNPYNIGFQKNIYLRPICHQCPFKIKNPVADITLGDFWQLLKYQPSLINRKGTSAVIVNTERGKQAIHHILDYLSLKECPFEYLEKDSQLRISSRPSPKRESFFADLDRMTFEELTKVYMKPRCKITRKLSSIRRAALKWM